MLLGYNFKDPVKWATERMLSKKGYQQEIIVSIVVGFATVAVVIGAQLMRDLSTGSLIITVGICCLVLDAIVLRGILYAMALRRLVLERRKSSGEDTVTPSERHQSKEKDE